MLRLHDPTAGAYGKALSDLSKCRRESNRMSARRSRAREAEQSAALDLRLRNTQDRLAECERGLTSADAQAADARAALVQLRDEHSAVMADVRFSSSS